MEKGEWGIVPGDRVGQEISQYLRDLSGRLYRRLQETARRASGGQAGPAAGGTRSGPQGDGIAEAADGIWVTLYSHELLPNHPGIELRSALANFLHLFDVLTLWTWNSEELPKLDESLAALEAVALKSCRIALGMYVWDFHNNRPVPVELMKHQCESGLKWLHEKRIHEMIFLGNTGLDLGLPSVDFARKWIAEVGGQALL